VIEGQLASASGERDALLQERSTLQARINSDEKTSAMLQEKLNQAASEMLACTRQLQGVQAELRHANRRADDAEKLQKDLQIEGTSLMHSVDEMRPKIVELTGAKLELTERVDGLQHALRERDTAIVELESTVEDLRKEKDEADQQWRETLARREAERASAQASSTDFQTAYSELQAELNASRASVSAFEADRTNYQQQADRQFEEINRLTTSSQEQWGEITTLRRELDELRSAQDEEQGFLERAQNEIESLRSEVSSKDEEIERLRNAVASSPLPPGAPRSLDDELLNSAQQQHVLDLSTIQSKNRELETAIFEADAKVHSLQKQVRSLETQLAQSTSASRAELSPSIPSRPSSRNVNHNDLRRASFHSRKSSGAGLPPLPSMTRSIIDIGLSPDARHKRQISLSMLKARIDSEMAASSIGNHPPPSRGISPTGPPLPTVREPSVSPPLPAHASAHRPQFLDEAHVFWCHSCHGDLVVL
jgi:chromosome segregation ATPase